MPFSFFRCLICNEQHTLEQESDKWTCSFCGKVYNVIEGIPFLVRDEVLHAQMLQEQINKMPNWYAAEQPPEEVSPWKHHLKKRREYIESVIITYLHEKGKTKAETLLDLGCGDGNNLRFLSKYGNDVWGSDYNILRLLRAQRHNPTVPIFLADILDYPAGDNFFELIFFNHVLEHIKEDKQALAAVLRILKPKGLLILGVPNEGAWWWQLAYRLEPQSLILTDHVQFYTAKKLRKKMEEQGFIIKEIEHIGWGPPHWGLDARIRKYQWVDDLFEIIGKRLFPHQASSLYIIATKG